MFSCKVRTTAVTTCMGHLNFWLVRMLSFRHHFQFSCDKIHVFWMSKIMSKRTSLARQHWCPNDITLFILFFVKKLMSKALKQHIKKTWKLLPGVPSVLKFRTITKNLNGWIRKVQNDRFFTVIYADERFKASHSLMFWLTKGCE